MLPPVDIICGGSPCQDLSVAGARAGLAGERSGLFTEQTPHRKGDERCRQITRSGRYPYSAPIYGMGKWCDTFLTEKVRRKNERMVKKHLQN